MFSALVEFLEPSEARKAFTKLAYTKYKHLPLYLEWAPDNTFITPAPKSSATRSSNVEEVKEEVTQETKKNENNTSKKVNDDEEPEPDTTLFVKNINFSTTTEQLKSVSD